MDLRTDQKATNSLRPRLSTPARAGAQQTVIERARPRPILAFQTIEPEFVDQQTIEPGVFFQRPGKAPIGQGPAELVAQLGTGRQDVYSASRVRSAAVSRAPSTFFHMLIRRWIVSIRDLFRCTVFRDFLPGQSRQRSLILLGQPTIAPADAIKLLLRQVLDTDQFVAGILGSVDQLVEFEMHRF